MSFHETTPPQSVHQSDLLTLSPEPQAQTFEFPDPVPPPPTPNHDLPPHMTSMRTPSRGHSSPELPAQIFRSFRYTPDMMPMLGERGAPPLFKGSHEKVKSFLKKFNTLCARYSVTDSADNDSDSSDDESEEDEDKIRAQLKALKTQKAHKSRARKSRTHDSAVDPVMEEVQAVSPTYPSHRTSQHRKPSSGDSEVEDLIKKMSQMNIKDPDYAVTYYRAFCLDERIARIFPEPAKQAIQASNREFSRQSSTTPRSSLPPPANQTANPSTSQNFPPRPPLKCYGCGGQGHGLRRCPPLNDLVNQGIISRDAEGHYTWPNGELIRRNFGEDYLPAIQRIRSQASPVVSNFITSFEPEDYMSEGEEEEEEAEEYLAEVEPIDVLAAERAPKTVTMTRKDVLGKPSNSKTRPTVSEDTGRRTRSKGTAPEPRGAPNVRAKPATSEIPALANPVPADIRPRHEFTAEDIAMADDESPGPRKGNAAEAKPNDRVARTPRASTRQAEILDPEEQEALFRRGLESTFQISLQEYLAVSNQ
ncbi:hypothetical protein EYR38_009916 [Pleurotus pulmonarius]|nr:hypothetical protein EYR38_009916 [Pleurotus pulmonarius]